MQPLPEIPLIANPITPEAKQAVGFKWSDAGGRHKIGGCPDWIQKKEIPTCEACAKEMRFYGQLDSVGDALCIADCGRIYVFVCFDCHQSKSIIQSN
ncbi:hypothetical protein OH491_16555 [Termitidicoccus mucosus]|uniref:Uncharacterized protein n=1 Tax=Termitidicoccus mucosus TaxID=1184151 RepID=A0A178IKQ3_9BACT|nr:hypothetical protein AW736_11995 [Opitutaceae bacterium TSB47]